MQEDMLGISLDVSQAFCHLPLHPLSATALSVSDGLMYLVDNWFTILEKLIYLLLLYAVPCDTEIYIDSSLYMDPVIPYFV